MQFFYIASHKCFCDARLNCYEYEILQIRAFGAYLLCEIDCSRSIRHEIASSNGTSRRVIIDVERKERWMSASLEISGAERETPERRRVHAGSALYMRSKEKERQRSKSASTWEHVGQCLSSHSRQVNSRTTNFSWCFFLVAGIKLRLNSCTDFSFYLLLLLLLLLPPPSSSTSLAPPLWHLHSVSLSP